MEFRLDAGQVDLQQTVARFCADRFPLDTVADREGRPVDPAAWRALADLGVLGLLLDDSGLGVVEAALVFEQLGSHLAPGPLLWTVLAAPLVDAAATGEVRVGGSEAGDRLVGGAVTGDRLVGGCDAGDLDHDGGATVEHAAEIDVLLVVGDDGVAAHRTADLDPPEDLDPLDPLTPVGRFPNLPAEALVAGPEVAAELRLRGAVLAAAALAGLAARAVDVARTYALERHQFGVPIGSFQAVKHLLADMYLQATLAQSAVYAAAAVLDETGSNASPTATRPATPEVTAAADHTDHAAGAGDAASRAKLLAAEAAIANAGTAVQVLGGMGFTWDMLPHRLLKRAWVLEHAFGTADDHALHLGSTLVVAGR